MADKFRLPVPQDEWPEVVGGCTHTHADGRTAWYDVADGETCELCGEYRGEHGGTTHSLSDAR